MLTKITPIYFAAETVALIACNRFSWRSFAVIIWTGSETSLFTIPTSSRTNTPSRPFRPFASRFWSWCFSVRSSFSGSRFIAATSFETLFYWRIKINETIASFWLVLILACIRSPVAVALKSVLSILNFDIHWMYQIIGSQCEQQGHSITDKPFLNLLSCFTIIPFTKSKAIVFSAGSLINCIDSKSSSITNWRFCCSIPIWTVG